MQVRRRGKVTGVKSGHQSWSQRVIEHGGQEATLHDSGFTSMGIDPDQLFEIQLMKTLSS